MFFLPFEVTIEATGRFREGHVKRKEIGKFVVAPGGSKAYKDKTCFRNQQFKEFRPMHSTE